VNAGTVTVGFLHPGNYSACFAESLTDLLLHDLSNRQRIVSHAHGKMGKECGSGGIVAGRNAVTKAFLDESEAEWLFFIDSDMGFAADTVDRLVDAADVTERPVVGGLCFAMKTDGRSSFYGVRYRATPTLYEFADLEDRVGFVPMFDYPRDELVAVAATGAACIIIHREVAETVRSKYGEVWWDPVRHPSGTTFSEDLSFCVRVAGCDVPMFVDTSVKTTHDKGSTFLDEEFYDTQQMVRKLTAVPTWVVIPFKDRADLTRPLLGQLLGQDVDRVLLYDNGSNQETKDWLSTVDDPRVEVVDAPDMNLHQMWNDGLDRAAAAAPRCNVAILNNDLAVPPDMLSTLAKALRADPALAVVCPNYDGRDGTGVEYVDDICSGRYDGTGGLAGFAFMLCGEAAYRFPTDLAWWYGDSDMMMTVQKAGARAGIVLDATVEHVNGGSQTGDWNAMRDVIAADRETFRAKWETEGVTCGDS